MTLTKAQHQEFVITSQQNLASFNELTVNGTTYTQKSIGKYTSKFVGSKGAEYMVLVTGSYYVTEGLDLPVYEICRNGRTVNSFVILNGQIVSL